MTTPSPTPPVPFGVKTCWYAVRSEDGAAVAEAFGLVDGSPATWDAGLEAAYAGSVFVTPPVAGWTLVTATSLAHDVERPDGASRDLLATLSQRFGEAQLFATHRVVELHVWARARDGVCERAYAYLGESGEVLVDDGAPTPAEVELGFDFVDPATAEEADWEREDALVFVRSQKQADEESVMALAARWSVSPMALGPDSAPPALGWLATPQPSAPRRGARARAKKPWWRFW